MFYCLFNSRKQCRGIQSHSTRGGRISKNSTILYHQIQLDPSFLLPLSPSWSLPLLWGPVLADASSLCSPSCSSEGGLTGKGSLPSDRGRWRAAFFSRGASGQVGLWIVIWEDVGSLPLGRGRWRTAFFSRGALGQVVGFILAAFLKGGGSRGFWEEKKSRSCSLCAVLKKCTNIAETVDLASFHKGWK